MYLKSSPIMSKLWYVGVHQGTLMQALLDFTLSSREALQKAVVFLIVSVTGRVLFPVRHAEAASSEAVSVLWVGGRGKIGC